MKDFEFLNTYIMKPNTHVRIIPCEYECTPYKKLPFKKRFLRFLKVFSIRLGIILGVIVGLIILTALASRLDHYLGIYPMFTFLVWILSFFLGVFLSEMLSN